MNLPPNLIIRRELPESRFPFLLEALHPETREVVWSSKIEKPPAGKQMLVSIPALRKQLGHPVAIRVTYPDGTTDEQEPILPS